MRVVIFALMGLSAFASSVSAAPVTVACGLLNTTTYATRYIEIDQIVFDIENHSIDVRSAKTVGTSDLVNWLFTTRKDDIFDDLFTMRGGPDWFAGGGVYNSVPVAMELTTSGLFTMTYIYRGGTEVLRWQCVG